MKNDDKFQISHSAVGDDAIGKGPQISTMQLDLTGSTPTGGMTGNVSDNLQSLTESRFRQGLEASLDYTGASSDET